MILSFADEKAQKVFGGVPLTQKELSKFGALHILKAEARLQMLHQATEKNLLTATSLHYHALSGTARYSIDADSRKSKWRITLTWQDDTKKDVQLVRIEDTHK